MMTTDSWEEIGQNDMAEITGRALFVDDETFGHYRHLRDGEKVEDALACYASTYEAGGKPQQITVRWHLYEDGRQMDIGFHSFLAR